MTRAPIGRSSRRKSSPEKRTRGGEPLSVTTTCDYSSYSFLSVFKVRIGSLPKIQDRPLIRPRERAKPNVRVHCGGAPHHCQHGVIGSAVGIGKALVQRQSLPNAILPDRVRFVGALDDGGDHLAGGNPAD